MWTSATSELMIAEPSTSAETPREVTDVTQKSEISLNDWDYQTYSIQM